jgi:hypothetical protein
MLATRMPLVRLVIRVRSRVLERLEAENRELRNRAIQLELQIQTLRHVGGSEVRSARGRMRQQGAASRRRWP